MSITGTFNLGDIYDGPQSKMQEAEDDFEESAAKRKSILSLMKIQTNLTPSWVNVTSKKHRRSLRYGDLFRPSFIL